MRHTRIDPSEGPGDANGERAKAMLGTRREPRPDSDLVTTVMSAPVISVGPAETLKAATQLMVDRGVGALPVVDDGRVVGMLTQSDVVTALARR